MVSDTQRASWGAETGDARTSRMHNQKPHGSEGTNSLDRLGLQAGAFSQSCDRAPSPHLLVNTRGEAALLTAQKAPNSL